MSSEPLAKWCDDAAVADGIAALFVAHADPSYISHSELQIGRATDVDTWAADLADRVRRLALEATSSTSDAGSRVKLALLSREGRLVGFAFVTFAATEVVPYATLEDLLLVPEERGSGSGSRFLGWIAEECRRMGMRRLFLESGISNHQAHDFFRRNDFHQTSIVMMRDL